MKPITPRSFSRRELPLQAPSKALREGPATQTPRSTALGALGLAVALALLPGCVPIAVHSHRPRVVRVRRPTVVAPAPVKYVHRSGHVHHHGCGH